MSLTHLFLANRNSKSPTSGWLKAERSHYIKISDHGNHQRTDKSSWPPLACSYQEYEYFENTHKGWEERCIVAKNYLQAMDSEVGLKPFSLTLTPIVSLMVSSNALAITDSCCLHFWLQEAPHARTECPQPASSQLRTTSKEQTTAGFANRSRRMVEQWLSQLVQHYWKFFRSPCKVPKEGFRGSRTWS